MVREMKIPKGYKQTEVGVIPEDWACCKLDEAVDFLDGQRRPVKSSDRTKMQGIYPYYGASGIVDYVNDYIFDEELILLGEDGENILSRSLPLAFRVSGKIWVNNHAHVMRPKKDFDIGYLTEFLESLNYSLLNSGTAQPKLNKQTCLNIKVAKPTIEEQQAIAEALGDVDGLIRALDKLIAKKRNIKQGTMQKLLSSKKGWETNKLPELVWFQEGPGVRNTQFTASGVKLLNGTNIENGKLLLDKTSRYISKNEAYGWYSHFLVDDGDILIACSGISVDKFHEKVTEANKSHLPLCMNTSTMRFKIKSNKISKLYFFHFLKSNSFKQQIGGQATGSAQLNFGPFHVKRIEIELPSLEEQENIAQILSDMDTEIETLEQKRAKYKSIKQGMMQELLTGKTRLI